MPTPAIDAIQIRLPLTAFSTSIAGRHLNPLSRTSSGEHFDMGEEYDKGNSSHAWMAAGLQGSGHKTPNAFFSSR